jgi:hypothetical protein
MIFGIFGTQLFAGLLAYQCRATAMPVPMPAAMAMAMAMANTTITTTTTAAATAALALTWPLADEMSVCTPHAGAELVGGWGCAAGSYCGSEWDPPAEACAAAGLDCASASLAASRAALPPADFNFGYTNFDNIGNAFLTIFQVKCDCV